MKELEERRRRAMEAWRDGQQDPYDASYTAVEEAIETATRVKITREAIDAGREAWSAASGSWTEDPGPRETARLAASLRALGFEVEE